jgi:N-acetylmuramoyl-L-alanine amidase
MNPTLPTAFPTPRRRRASLLAVAACLVLSACATGPHIDRSYTSENQDSRALFLVLHYTVSNWESSLKVLTTGGQVSAHYLVRDDPVRSYALVDESRRAWHAGPSYWAGNSNLNASSIGIEIVNPGYTDGPMGRVYAPFAQKQIDEVILLVKDIVARQQIRPDRIIGHADIAPGRKQDPGPAFPWKQLADAGIIPWPDATKVAERLPIYSTLLPDAAWFQDKLARVGYQVPRDGELNAATTDVIATFQMKYRPSNYSGTPDAETAALLDVVTLPGGMLLNRPGGVPAVQRTTSRW